ncbi:hypothetical protein SSX86_004130 [Deinandra increscens subsp. villosa]|uniref:Uncharacterized protein n=1 Tax=Deinandra increscens subsp. villosa TaxID=3103831 RepID=A0AAP0DJL7_9ASTR
MGSGEALKAARVYRELMKTVKKHIGKEEHKTHFRDFIKSEFRKDGGGLEPSFIQQKMKLASDYTYLLNSVHHHQIIVGFRIGFRLSAVIPSSSQVCRLWTGGLHLLQEAIAEVVNRHEEFHKVARFAFICSNLYEDADIVTVAEIMAKDPHQNILRKVLHSPR